jgi:hypothetical protein
LVNQQWHFRQRDDQEPHHHLAHGNSVFQIEAIT